MKRLNLRKLTTWVGLAAGLALAGPASATLLQNPMDLPLLSFDNGGSTTYNGGILNVEANPIALRLTAGATPRFVTPVPGGDEYFRIGVQLDALGNLVGGLVGLNDLEIFGAVDLDGDNVQETQGVLLTGEVTAFGSQNGGSTDLFDFAFTVTGGLLAEQMGGLVGVSLQSENSSFTGSFAEPFGGKAKGTLGVIPEPTTALLLAAGLLGLTRAGMRRKA